MEELDELDKLEILSLLSNISSELVNYTGINDKTLAEFILNLYEESSSFDEFKKKLLEVGGQFPDSFCESIHRLVMTMHPKYKNGEHSKFNINESETKKKNINVSKEFTGLALPDLNDDPFEFLKSEDDFITTSDNNNDEKNKYKDNKLNDKSLKNESANIDYRNEKFKSKHNRKRSSTPPFLNSNKYEKELDEEPQLNKIYNGKVTNIKDFGAFVTLYGVKGRVDGLVHVSAILQKRRVEHPGDVLRRNQMIKVKVIAINNSRISLSMKEVDQNTGKDLSNISNSNNLDESYDDFNTNDLSYSKFESNDRDNRFTRKRQRTQLTSPERWEIKQLIAAGAISAQDYPDLDNDDDTYQQDEDDEDLQDIDIEIREEEPPFLKGQTKATRDLSPIRIVKAPDGSMNRAAMTGSTLAQEYREERNKRLKENSVNNNNNDSNTEKKDDPVLNQPSYFRPFKEKSSAADIKSQKESLPVYKLKDQLIQAVKENQILVVVGETGSGKTTQITQYLAEAGFAKDKRIGCTQPRRVAAISVAKRVAEEVGCFVGEEVGYTIRFDDCTSDLTKIKYMTDGMLEREILLDPSLSKYSVIMLDEAHERTIATDILFALMKKTLRARPDMRLIVTSATLDAERFSEYFNKCPIVFIPGRTYPVDILYTKEPESDYLEATLITVMQIHLSEPPGDILVFLTGQEEIDASCAIMKQRMEALGSSVPELVILPAYSALPTEEQNKIFDPAPPGSRKVIFATNIAETSITIDGIYYVVDPGFVKLNAFDPKLGMDSLVVSPISQAQARQRSGRAGRTGPGKCYRLYTESAYENEMLPNTMPEIQRQNLSHTILMLKAMGINNLLEFEFMDSPPLNTMLGALEELYALSALDNEGLLTRLGRKMADFPMEPTLAKVLIVSVEMGCSSEMLTIVAMLSVPNIFSRPKEKQEIADQKKMKFHSPYGDHLTFLNVYQAWKRNNSSVNWCFDNFIQSRNMRKAEDVRLQLVRIMERYKHKITSCGNNLDVVRKALCTGFFRNSAKKDAQEGYKTLIESTPVFLHPSSALFRKPAEYVIYHTLVLTSKEYMHQVTTIEPKWLVEAAPTFFKVADPTTMSKRKKYEKIQPMFNRFSSDPNEWRLSARKKVPKGNNNTFG